MDAAVSNASNQTTDASPRLTYHSRIRGVARILNSIEPSIVFLVFSYPIGLLIKNIHCIFLVLLQMKLLRILMGPVISLNLRNLVWHGFPTPGQIPDEYSIFLMIICITVLYLDDIFMRNNMMNLYSLRTHAGTCSRSFCWHLRSAHISHVLAHCLRHDQ